MNLPPTIPFLLFLLPAPLLTAPALASGGPPVPALPARGGAPDPPDDPVARVFAGFETEPPVDLLVRRALEAARLEPERVADDLRVAARNRLLPEIRVYTEGKLASDAAPSHLEPGATRPGPDKDGRLGLELRWDLSAGVDPDRLLRAHREERARLDLRLEIAELVTELYFERRRLMAEDALRPGTVQQRIRRTARIAEIEALLDLLSGGAFSQEAPGDPQSPPGR